ncbi:anti-sigma factor [Cyanobacterium stanieri LEGE 03274]|uniref:Anti-sigma factor n=1 Tax=Cyanobacterium stanieri LEGE 03274 TaxID=1828756 RepID=A0ABR9V3Q8_9CHRO|nr:anti-sigma factor [Cyanobacterium stanieri]MBE9222535.1 anti-sigma factor [Cyanobacterium stanieri LEGE 03274]
MKDFKEEEIKELLASYVLGDSTPEETSTVHQLLQSKPELQEEIESLQKTLALYPLALPEVELPKTLGDRILAQAKQENQIIPKTTTIVKHRPLPLIFSAISAMLIIVLGGYSYGLQRQVARMDKELQEYQSAIALLRQKNNNLVSLQGTESNPQSSGSLLVNTDADTIMVITQNLSPIAENKVYRLWGIVDGEKIYCGEFKPDSQGNSLIKFPLDPDMLNPSQIVITLENSKSDLSPQGQPVMVSNL